MYYKDGSIIKGEWKDGSVFGFAIETDFKMFEYI